MAIGIEILCGDVNKPQAPAAAVESPQQVRLVTTQRTCAIDENGEFGAGLSGLAQSGSHGKRRFGVLRRWIHPPRDGSRVTTGDESPF